MLAQYVRALLRVRVFLKNLSRYFCPSISSTAHPVPVLILHAGEIRAYKLRGHTLLIGDRDRASLNT